MLVEERITWLLSMKLAHLLLSLIMEVSFVNGWGRQMLTAVWMNAQGKHVAPRVNKQLCR